jgi:two-component system, sensor histidine kinase YesM
MTKTRMSSYFQFKSIQSTIAVAFSCLIVFTIAVPALMSYSLSADAVEKNSREYTYLLIDQVNTNIETYINYMENISQMVLSSYDIKEYLRTQAPEGRQNRDQRVQKISSQLGSVLSMRKDISSILIFGNHGEVIPYNLNIMLNPYVNPNEQSWYKQALEAQGQVVISSSHVQNIIKDEYNWVVSLSRELRSEDGQEKLGVLLVDLNYSVINDLCNKIRLGKKGYIFILDPNGSIVYHPQQQLIYSNLKSELIEEVLAAGSGSFVTSKGGSSRIYTIKESNNTGWKIVGVAYVDELVTNKKEIQTSIILGGILFLIIAVVLSIVISLHISRPIKLLADSMKMIEKGNFDTQVDVNSSNEIGQLGLRFNRMTAKIKELMIQNIQEQELKRKSELKALQAQINPHFLYNTLDSIIWMAEVKKAGEVVLMVSSLAKLFRISLSKGDEIISIRNEIEHIKSYLTIQKMRYKDKLDFEVEVDDSILSYKTIKIILQPLVENSIYHGIKNKDGAGLVRITGSRVGDKIVLSVIDNGIGMAPETLEALLQKPVSSEQGSGMGVNNVNQRIKLYYGEEYGLQYESEPDQGTAVHIWLPVREQ